MLELAIGLGIVGLGALVTSFIFDELTEEEKSKKTTRRRKSTITGFTDDDNGDINPIQIDTSDSNYFENNEDAIIFDLKRGNSN